jgi:hypothetical protein
MVILASVTGGPSDIVIGLFDPGEYQVHAARLSEFVVTSLEDEDLCEKW